MSELEILQQQVKAVDRCQINLDAANAELKKLDGRKLYYPTAREYNEAVSAAQENVILSQNALDLQILMNARANGFTQEMEAY